MLLEAMIAAGPITHTTSGYIAIAVILAVAIIGGAIRSVWKRRR